MATAATEYTDRQAGRRLRGTQEREMQDGRSDLVVVLNGQSDWYGVPSTLVS